MFMSVAVDVAIMKGHIAMALATASVCGVLAASMLIERARRHVSVVTLLMRTMKPVSYAVALATTRLHQ